MLLADQLTSSSSNSILQTRDLGLISYQAAWQLQKQLQQDLIAGNIPEQLLLCEHNPTITVGRSGKIENLLVDRATLIERGVDFFAVERGGDVTYHGPGQLVCYPILDLNRHRRDVHWYMRSLEEVIIRVLAHYGVQGHRSLGRTGVWTGNQQNDTEDVLEKIASIGVRISRWCSLHGFSLNVADVSDGFSMINPCGYQDVRVSSLGPLVGQELSVEVLKPLVITEFKSVFDLE